MSAIGGPAPGPTPGAPGAPAPVGFTAGGVTIQADPANNALVVMAPEPLYNNIRAIVEKLDTRRAQVFVEALIVEISADRASQFGIQWQYLQPGSGSTYVGGGTNFGTRQPSNSNNIIDISGNIGAAGQGLNLGLIRGTVTIPGLGVITNLALLVRALQGDNTANILSTPNLLMLDNEESKIVVGQNVPFITGQYAQTGSTSTVTPFQTIERKDVGLTLRVRPQITEGGTVRMAVYEEVSRVSDTSNPAGIITDKRSLESTVLVEDGQIIVLGGLITDSQTDGTQKLPFLGDIPVAGALFRYDTRNRTKTNLMVFLRPTIVRNATTSLQLTTDRYDYIIGEQKAIRTDPNVIPPVLPNMDDPRLQPTLPPGSTLMPPPSQIPLPALIPQVPPPAEPSKP
jgi:general secretion pathway protein D